METGIRVKLVLHGIESECYSYLIPGLHVVPRVGDMIDIGDMIVESNYSEDQLNKIFDLVWDVYAVHWRKDNEGFYADIICEGE